MHNGFNFRRHCVKPMYIALRPVTTTVLLRCPVSCVVRVLRAARLTERQRSCRVRNGSSKNGDSGAVVLFCGIFTEEAEDAHFGVDDGLRNLCNLCALVYLKLETRFYTDPNSMRTSNCPLRAACLDSHNDAEEDMSVSAIPGVFVASTVDRYIPWVNVSCTLFPHELSSLVYAVCISRSVPNYLGKSWLLWRIRPSREHGRI